MIFLLKVNDYIIIDENFKPHLSVGRFLHTVGNAWVVLKIKLLSEMIINNDKLNNVRMRSVSNSCKISVVSRHHYRGIDTHVY